MNKVSVDVETQIEKLTGWTYSCHREIKFVIATKGTRGADDYCEVALKIVRGGLRLYYWADRNKCCKQRKAQKSLQGFQHQGVAMSFPRNRGSERGHVIDFDITNPDVRNSSQLLTEISPVRELIAEIMHQVQKTGVFCL